MDMMLNSLPSRTWNRLGINESFIKIENESKEKKPEVSGNLTQAIYTENAGEGLRWPDMITGMGKDMNLLTEKDDLLTIRTEAGVHMETPVILTYTYENEEYATGSIRLHAEKGSSLSVILVLASKDKQDKGLSAIQTKIVAEEGANVHLYVVQILGKGYTCLNDIGGVLEQEASVKLTKLWLGAGKTYVGTHMDLKGNESSFQTEIGYHVHGDQKLDMNYVALHHGKKTNSLMEVNGTLEEGAEKVFRGSIDFKQGSAGSKGTENENVLLLGDNMINQTIPLILCTEEDVEGNHGASIGRLDDKVLFYLSTRGIAEEDAQQIMAQSRIDAVCEKIPDETIQEMIHNFEDERGVFYVAGE